MAFISDPECIRCRFQLTPEVEPKVPRGILDVFFSDSDDLYSLYPDLLKYISNEEKARAGKIIPVKIRETYIISHAVLRLYLARYLNINPPELIFNYSEHSKPGIEKNPVYFNLSHTNGAFAFAISLICYVGIDIEAIDRKLDIHALVKSYFSKSEQDYIFESDEEKEARFFLLWTRKESLLKALGMGLIDELGDIEVSGQNNIMKREVFGSLTSDEVLNDHYIFSTRHNNNLLSVTVPIDPVINLVHINADNLTSLLSGRKI